MKETVITVIGGGLAGTEAAWQVAQKGFRVNLFEMRPLTLTGAHVTPYLAELVCSNSLGSTQPDHASGILHNELKRLNSLLLECAQASSVPAGSALAVDREVFSRMVTEKITGHPMINLVREEVKQIPQGIVIIASGPLTSEALSSDIARLTGKNYLYFYDAIAPIIEAQSIDMTIAFRASRFSKGEPGSGDYINCPFSKQEYDTFIAALVDAARIPLRHFESELKEGTSPDGDTFFEGCLPVEILARRGPRSLAFGPMRPIGLTDPHTGKGAYAIVQLRQDNLVGSHYNMVGFQTNLTYSEQKRVFRLIPGLERAVFIRYGQMHRNTYISSPNVLLPTLQFRDRPELFFAGQITGVEGYLGNIATGLLAGLNSVRVSRSQPPLCFPKETVLGSLCHYISHAETSNFQPMKANLGLLPPIMSAMRLGKKERAKISAERAIRSLDQFCVMNQVDEI